MAGDKRILTGPVLTFGPFRLLPAERVLQDGERPVRVGSRALDILLALIERPGELVAKEELIAWVWPNIAVARRASDAITSSSWLGTVDPVCCSMAESAMLEIASRGVCKSLTTPEISRPTAASFSLLESCSRKDRCWSSFTASPL